MEGIEEIKEDFPNENEISHRNNYPNFVEHTKNDFINVLDIGCGRGGDLGKFIN